MLRSNFLQKTGLFVRDDFFRRDECETLRGEMDSAKHKSAKVIQGNEGMVNEDIRRTKIARPNDDVAELVRSRLIGLTSQLQDHFAVQLSELETPQFLLYNPGAYFRLHSDNTSSDGAVSFLQGRVISVVLFLNDQSPEPSTETFGGGELVLYGLLDGANWAMCPIPVRGHAGRLIAFRSNLKHEVKPILFGNRYTIVSWYHQRP